MASYTTTPRKVRVTRAWAQSRHEVGAVTITKPNGQVIVIPAHAVKVAKRKQSKHKARRSSKQVAPLTRKVSEQDHLAIALEERRQALMRDMGSIHIDSND